MQITKHNHSTTATHLNESTNRTGRAPFFVSFYSYILFNFFFLCFLCCSYLDYLFPCSLWPSIFFLNFHKVQGAQDTETLQLNNSKLVMLVGKKCDRRQNNFISCQIWAQEWIHIFLFLVQTLKALSILWGLNNNWKTMNSQRFY